MPVIEDVVVFAVEVPWLDVQVGLRVIAGRFFAVERNVGGMSRSAVFYIRRDFVYVVVDFNLEKANVSLKVMRDLMLHFMVFYHSGCVVLEGRTQVKPPFNVGYSLYFFYFDEFDYGRSGSVHSTYSVGEIDDHVLRCEGKFCVLEIGKERVAVVECSICCVRQDVT